MSQDGLCARRPAETAFERYRYQPCRLDVCDGSSDRLQILAHDQPPVGVEHYQSDFPIGMVLLVQNARSAEIMMSNPLH